MSTGAPGNGADVSLEKFDLFPSIVLITVNLWIWLKSVFHALCKGRHVKFSQGRVEWTHLEGRFSKCCRKSEREAGFSAVKAWPQQALLLRTHWLCECGEMKTVCRVRLVLKSWSPVRICEITNL